MSKIIFLIIFLFFTNCIPQAKLNNPMHSAGLMTQLLNMVVNPQDTSPPSFGGVSSVTSAGSNSILLSWTAAQDNVTPQNSIVYDIYMAPQKGWENYNVVSFSTTGGATSFTAAGLSENTTYYFVVRARDSAGNRDSNTAELSAVTWPIPQILSVSTPNSELTAGDQITVSGTNFDSDPASYTLKLGACTLNVVNSTSTSITAAVPSDRTCTSGKIIFTSKASNLSSIYPTDYKYFHNLLIVANTDGSVSSYLLNAASDPMSRIETPSVFTPVAVGTPVSIDYHSKYGMVYVQIWGQSNLIGNTLSDDGSIKFLSTYPSGSGTGTFAISPNSQFMILGTVGSLATMYYYNTLLLPINFYPFASQTNSLQFSPLGNFLFASLSDGFTYVVPVSSDGTLNSFFTGSVTARSVMFAPNENVAYFTNNSNVFSYFINPNGSISGATGSSSCPGATQPLYGVRDSLGYLYVNGGSKICSFSTSDGIGMITAKYSIPMGTNILEKTLVVDFYNRALLSLQSSSTSTILNVIPIFISGMMGTNVSVTLNAAKVPLASKLVRQYR